MKNYISLLSFALCLLACSKVDEPITPVTPVTPEVKELQFYGGIDSTKTTLDLTNGATSWVVGDEVIIEKYASEQATTPSETKTYVVSSTTATGRAVFTVKSGTGYTTSGYYKAKYKSGIIPVDQVYDSTKIGSEYPLVSDMLNCTAEEGKNFMFMFSPVYSVIYVSVGTGDVEISKIKVSNGTSAYSVNFSSPVKMTAGTDYYPIAVAGGTYNKLTFARADGAKIVTNLTNTITIEEGHLQKIKLTNKKYSVAANYDYCISGEYTINASGKKVKFMSGNLYWNGSAYAVEDSQYGTATDRTNANHISHFWPIQNECIENFQPYWTKNFLTQYSTYKWNTYSVDKQNPFCHNINFSGYRILSVANKPNEWDYITNERNQSLKYTAGCTSPITISGEQYKGFVLYPDGYNGDPVTTGTWTWEKIETLGIVFLPCTGYGNWEGTMGGKEIVYMLTYGTTSDMYTLKQNEHKANTINGSACVRLVKEVN